MCTERKTAHRAPNGGAVLRNKQVPPPGKDASATVLLAPGAAVNKAVGALPGNLQPKVMETASSAEQALLRWPWPGEVGDLLCPGGNLGCLAQSRPTLSQKPALMRVVGPVSFRGSALKQHKAESTLLSLGRC